MILDSPSERKALLQRSKSIAMVGASPKPERPSNEVFLYMRAHGYEVTPITPAADEVDGVAAYDSLREYAAERGAPDIVDVFRKADEVGPVVDEAIEVGAKAIWFQLGVVNEDAIRRADAAGLDVVVDECIKVDHRELLS